MRPAWLILRADLRRRWRPMLAMAVLTGLVGGVVLVAAAGARRTDTAFPRFLSRSHAADLLVSPARSGFGGYFRAVAGLPQVASADTVAFLQMSLPGPGASPFSGLVAEASLSGGEGVAINRVKVLSGRLFNPADPHAVMISPVLAAREHLRPGGTLHLIGYPQRQGRAGIRHVVRLAFRVSAIVVTDDEIVPATHELAYPRVLLSPAFSRTRLARSFNPAGGASYVVLRPGAAAAAFTSRAVALAAPYRVGAVQVVHLATERAAAQRAIQPEAVALAIFAALAGLIALAVIGQLLNRQLVLDSAEFPILRALGMGRSRLVLLSLARVALVTTAGAAAVGAGLAIAASPLMPIGVARLAEPDPGVEVNLAIPGGGPLAVAAVVPLLLVFPAAWLGPPHFPQPVPPGDRRAFILPGRLSRLGSALGLAGSVTGGLGVRMALEPGRGRTAVPVRSALAGTVVAVAALVAAAVFGTSLLGLVGVPHRYGQNWTHGGDVDFRKQPDGARAAGGPAHRHAAPGRRVRGGKLRDDRGECQSQGGRCRRSASTGSPRTRLPDPDLRAAAPGGPGEIALGQRTLRAIRGPAPRPAGPGQRLNGRGGPAAGGWRGRLPVLHRKRVCPATDLGPGPAVVAPSLLSTPDGPTGPVRTGLSTCYSFILIRYPPGYRTAPG